MQTPSYHLNCLHPTCKSTLCSFSISTAFEQMNSSWDWYYAILSELFEVCDCGDVKIPIMCYLHELSHNQHKSHMSISGRKNNTRHRHTNTQNIYKAQTTQRNLRQISNVRARARDCD